MDSMSTVESQDVSAREEDIQKRSPEIKIQNIFV